LTRRRAVAGETVRCVICWQAFTGNRSTCRKVTCRHVDKLIELLCKFGDQVPEYLDVLYAMVRVVGVGAETPLRHNQTMVMKYLMSSFAQVAVDFSSDKDVRYGITLSRSPRQPGCILPACWHTVQTVLVDSFNDVLGKDGRTEDKTVHLQNVAVVLL